MEQETVTGKKIVITGPESSGKTTLLNQLVAHFDCSSVDEYARLFISNLNRDYNQSDLITIAKGQLELEEIANSSFLICDTDLLTIKIWSDYKYGNCDSWIIDSLHRNTPDLYLLCKPDYPWVYDSQRENPTERDSLFELYLKEIKDLNVPFVLIEGGIDERLKNAIKFITFNT